MRNAIDSDRPELLGLACAAVGIDRSVFPSILAMIRGLNGGRPGVTTDELRQPTGGLGPLDRGAADRAFRAETQSMDPHLPKAV